MPATEPGETGEADAWNADDGDAPAIELPREDADLLHQVTTIEPGEPVMLGSFPDSSRPGNARYVIVSAVRHGTPGGEAEGEAGEK